MNKILLIGAGGHCQSCVEVIEQLKKFKIEGILDPFVSENKKFGYKIYRSDKDLIKIFKRIKLALITIGLTTKKDLLIREKYYNKLKNIGFKLPIIKSKSSYISINSSIEEGTIIFNNAFINAGVKIGFNSIINTGSIIEHGSSIGSNTHISTGVIINGSSQIGNNSFIGSGTVVSNNVVLKDKSFKRALKLIF